MRVPQKWQSSIICSSAISIGYLLSKIFKIQVASLKRQIATESAKESDDESTTTGADPEQNMIYHSDKSLQDDVKDTTVKLRSRNPEDGTSLFMHISYDSASECVRVLLDNYVAWMVTDTTLELYQSDLKVQLNERYQEKKSSIWLKIFVQQQQVSPLQSILAQHCTSSNKSGVKK